MYLEKRYNQKHHTYNLRIRRSYRTPDGKTHVSTVQNLGSYPEDDQEDLNLFTQLVDNINESIRMIDQEKKFNEEALMMEFDNDHILNLGSCFIKKVLALFDFRQDFAYLQRIHSKLDYQIYQDFFYLVEAAIIDPDSLREESRLQVDFFENYGLKQWDIYRSLDFINQAYDKISQRIARVVLDNFADSSNLFYIDATNTYVYSKEDEEDGGLRKYGKSKDDKDQYPLLGLTIVMTHNEFPLLLLIHPGSQHDSQLLIPAARELRELIGVDRFILCGDSAYDSSSNNFYLAGKNTSNYFNDGYVFSKSIKAKDKEIIKWLLNPDDWYTDSGYPIPPEIIKELINKMQNPEVVLSEAALKYENISRYKQRNITRTDHVWNREKTRKIPVKVNLKQVLFFNPKLYRKKLKTIERKVQKAQSLEENPDKADEFFQKAATDYAEVELKEAQITIDNQKVNLDKIKAGYYILETSERNLDPRTIAHIYSDKKWIEFNFRIWKSLLKLHPIFVWKTEHIKAVILIRFCALLVVKVLQFLLGYNYSPEEIINALRKFRCVPDKNKFLIFGHNGLIKDLEEIFGINFNKTMSKKEIKRNFSYNVEIFGSTDFCDFCNRSSLTLGDKKALSQKSNIKFKEKIPKIK